MSKNTVFSLTPPKAKVGIDIKSKSIIAITVPEKREIKVQLDKRSFRESYCKSCNLKLTEKELTTSMRAAKILCSTVNKISYCNTHNLCTGTDQMLAICPAGYNLNTFKDITIEVPSLLWEFNYQKSGKELFKLFAVKKTEEGEFTTPYLLSNVYTNPLACISWPKNQTRPTNLLQAYMTYWESPFSDESMLVDPENIHRTFIDYLESYTCKEDDNWSLLNNDTYIWLPPSEGVFFSTDPSIINSIPKRVWSNAEYVYGTVSQGENNQWLIKINDFLFTKTGKLSGTSKLNLIGQM